MDDKSGFGSLEQKPALDERTVTIVAASVAVLIVAVIAVLMGIS